MDRDTASDTSRDGFDNPGREAFMTPIDMGPMSVADQAEADAAAGRPTHTTRGWADTEAFENR